jgi:hypothetical protein
MFAIRAVTLFAASAMLAGCGLFVPDVREFYQDKLDEIADQNEIVNQVKCEIHRAADPKVNGSSVAWLSGWLAKVSLVLTVDEKGSLNPGFSLVEPFSLPNKGQQFSLGGGLSASSGATRTETIGFTYIIQNLLNEGTISEKCANENGILIHSDLKVADFIKVKSNLAKIPGTISWPYTAFTYEVKFIVAYGGNITPTWKLVRFTANPGSPFASATRTRTHDLLITFAANTSGPGQVPQISQEGFAQHTSSLLGQAVGAGVQSQRP